MGRTLNDGDSVMATIIGELIPLAAFIFLGAVILVPFYLRHKERMRMQDIVRSSVEQGHSAPTELIQALQLRGNGRLPASPERDLRRGIFWLAWAVACLAAAGLTYYYDPSDDGPGVLMALAAFPGFIGLAYLIVWFAGRNRPQA